MNYIWGNRRIPSGGGHGPQILHRIAPRYAEHVCQSSIISLHPSKFCLNVNNEQRLTNTLNFSKLQ